MKILIHPDIWCEYIRNNSKTTYTKTKEYKKIFDIISNEENLFAYNSEWTNFYESFLNQEEDDTADFTDIFNNIIVELNYQDKLFHENYYPINNSNDFNNCFMNSEKIQFLLLNKTLNHTFSDDKCVLILEQINKPNKSWIYYSILTTDTSSQKSVDYRHFNNNIEIKNFINDLLSLKNPSYNRIHIQSDYLNFGQLFESIKGRKLTYYSSEYSGATIKNPTTLSTEKNSINTYFGSRASYLVCRDRAITHPRTVFYNHIVINLNHDFAQIHVNNFNWFISFQYSINTYTEKMRLVKHYKTIS